MAMKTLSSAKVFKISTLRSYAKTRAMDAQLWNQVDLKPPPTSAQKMSLTSKGKSTTHFSIFSKNAMQLNGTSFHTMAQHLHFLLIIASVV